MLDSAARAAAVLALAAAAAFLAAEASGATAVALATKPIPVLLLAAAQLRAPEGRGRGLVAAGLVASAVGDVLLELPGDTFVPGLLAFLTAHVLYVAAFVGRVRRPAEFAGIAVAGYGIAMFLALLPGLGGLAVPVGVYVVVICAMAWRALALLGVEPPVSAALGALGALSFVASDSILAVNRFRTPVPAASLLIMVTYWAGQAGIAASTLVREEPRR